MAHVNVETPTLPCVDVTLGYFLESAEQRFALYSGTSGRMGSTDGICHLPPAIPICVVFQCTQRTRVHLKTMDNQGDSKRSNDNSLSQPININCKTFSHSH